MSDLSIESDYTIVPCVCSLLAALLPGSWQRP